MDYIRTKPLSPDVEMTQQTLEEISALSDQAAMVMFSRAMAMNASGDTARPLSAWRDTHVLPSFATHRCLQGSQIC